MSHHPFVAASPVITFSTRWRRVVSVMPILSMAKELLVSTGCGSKNQSGYGDEEKYLYPS